MEYTLLSNSLTSLLKLRPCGFKIEYTYLGFVSAIEVLLGSEGDPKCIFFTHDTYQATFISEVLLYYCRNKSKFSDTRTDARTEEEEEEEEGQTDMEVQIVV